MSKQKVLFEPEEGYDLVSSHFEHSKWATFWEKNESPIVQRWLNSLAPGFGLDAGTGTGTYISEIIKAGHSCIALDISNEMIVYNKKKHAHIPTNKVKFTRGEINDLLFDQGFFDWILCTRVLSHCADSSVVFNQFHRILKKNGECLITDIHTDHPYKQTAFWAGSQKIRIKTYKHSVTDLIILAEKTGFSVKNVIEIDLKNLLSKPSPLQFKKLYTFSEKKIFYVLTLKKP